MNTNTRRAAVLWTFACALFALFGVLGFLQYRWIGEVSRAERERLRGSLQSSLERLNQEFNAEIVSACRALLPRAGGGDADLESEIGARFAARRAAGQPAIFERIAIASPRNGEMVLRELSTETGAFAPADWPASWHSVRDRFQLWRSPDGRRDRRRAGQWMNGAHSLIEIPLFAGPLRAPAQPGARAPGPPQPPFAGRAPDLLILELNLRSIREAILPELIRRHLGGSAASDYHVEVVTRGEPSIVIFQSDPGLPERLADRADASAGLLSPRLEDLFRRRGGLGAPERPAAGPPPGRLAGFDAGRWEISVRHRAGSLDAAVARARARNLAVTAGVFLLMVASVLALIRSTRRAQRLAELQMDFVAGVSHELRTPLTVIHTAAFNLRGKVSANPTQVEKYGAMIQRESARLKEMVEHVLRFGSASAGRIIQSSEPVSVESIVREILESGCDTEGAAVETSIDAGLPPVLGDRSALKQAIQNLVGNAVKHGKGPTNCVGIHASAVDGGRCRAVRVAITDRGPGIPDEEQRMIFEPFYRGRRAIENQVHGAGLGLALVKRIVEAHGGTIELRSSAEGSEFIVTLPAAPAEAQA